MSFNVDPLNAQREIRFSKNQRDQHLASVHEIIRDFHGPHFRGDRGSDLEPAPENHPFEWIALVTTRIIHDNPVVEIASRYSGANKESITRLKHGVNQWANQVELWKTLLLVWYDMAFSFGVMRTTLNTMPGYKGYPTKTGKILRPKMPQCRRIPPGRFFIDTRTDNVQEARYMGHTWRRDKEDLLKASPAEGFDKKAIEYIADDAGMDEVQTRRGYTQEGGSDTYASPVSRHEIIGDEIWVPEHTLPEVQGDPNFNGTIFTLAYGLAEDPKNGSRMSAPAYIRKPRPYFGPATGPYEMFGAYFVPGYIFPLSPLVATYDQVKELNAHATAATRSAANFKQFIGYNPNNPMAGMTAKTVVNGEVVPIENLSDDIKEMKLGGVTPEQYNYIGFLKDRLDRVTGLSEAARGNVTGQGTATEVADAAAARDARLAYVAKMFNEATVGVLKKAAWFFHNSEFVQMKLGDSASEELFPRPANLPDEEEAETIAALYSDPGMTHEQDPLELRALPYEDRLAQIRQSLRWEPEVAFPSERPEDQYKSLAALSGIAFEDLDLLIEPHSMARTDQGMLQRRIQDQFALITRAALIMPQTPYINWPLFFERWGQALNSKDFGDILNGKMLKQIQQAVSGQQQGNAPLEGGQGLTPGPGGESQNFANMIGQDLAAAQRQ